MNKIIRLIALFGLLLTAGIALDVVLASEAIAQESGAVEDTKASIFGAEENVKTDRTYRFLESIFPSVFGDTKYQTVLNKLFERFTVFVMIISAFWVAWLTLGLLARGGTSGEAFGAKHSAFYGPVRILFGVGGLMPYYGGFPMLVGLVMFCAKWGIIGANTLHVTAVDFMSNQMMPLSRPQTSAHVGFLQNLFNMELCKDVINAYVDQQHAIRGVVDETEKVRPLITPWNNEKPLVWSYRFEGGPKYGWFNSERLGSMCGELKLDLTSFEDTHSTNLDANAAFSVESKIEQKGVWTELSQVHFQQLAKETIVGADGKTQEIMGPLRARIHAITSLIASEAVKQGDVNFQGRTDTELSEIAASFSGGENWISATIPEWLGSELNPTDSRHDSVNATVAIRRDTALAQSGVKPEHVIALIDYIKRYDSQASLAAINALSKIDGTANTGGTALRKMFYDEATAVGWSGLGRYWLTISRINGRTLNMANYRPSFKAPDQEALYEAAKAGIERPLRNAYIMAEQFWRFKYDGGAEKIEEYYDISREYTGEAVEGSYFSKAVLKWLAGVGPMGGGGPGYSTGSDGYTNTYSAIGDGDFTGGFLGLGNSEIDPISRMTELGHMLINAVYAALIGQEVGKDIGEGISMLGKIPGLGVAGKFGDIAGGAITGASSLLLVASFVILAAGIWFAFVMPFMVWIHYLLAVVGWLLLVLEAAAAAPIFALIHMNFRGEDFVEHRMIPGWLILLAIIVKPPLIVLSFYISMVMFGVCQSLLAADFYPWMMGVVGEHIAGPVTIAVMIDLMWAATMMLSKMSFRIMTIIPDNIISKWLQGPSTAAGEEQDAAAAAGAIHAGADVAKGVLGRDGSGSSSAERFVSKARGALRGRTTTTVSDGASRAVDRGLSGDSM